MARATSSAQADHRRGRACFAMLEHGVIQTPTATIAGLAVGTASLSAPAPTSLMQLIMPTKGEIARARRRVQANARRVIGPPGAGAYGGLVIADERRLLRVMSAAGLVIATSRPRPASCTTPTTAPSASSARVNRVLGYSADLLGASSWLWRFKHNHLHHGNTNVVGVDSDISQAPFARLAPEQPWRPWHRYQHLYLWFVYGFLAIKWLTFADFSNLARRRIGDQPLRRRPPRRDRRHGGGQAGPRGLGARDPAAVASLVGRRRFLLDLFVGRRADPLGDLPVGSLRRHRRVRLPDEPRRGENFELHQLRTTVDVDCRLVPLRWLMGGLDHQVEHHLAPRLPHTIYPLLAARLRPVCAERGIVYRVHPSLWAALEPTPAGSNAWASQHRLKSCRRPERPERRAPPVSDPFG